MCIVGLCRRWLDKLPVWTAAVTFVLWIVLRHFPQYIDLIALRIPLAIPEYRWLYPIGIRSKEFWSADYFPVIPYMLMFVTGYMLSPLVKGRKLPKTIYYETNAATAPVEFIGRHSLIIYLLHQPLIYGLMTLIFIK